MVILNIHVECSLVLLCASSYAFLFNIIALLMHLLYFQRFYFLDQINKFINNFLGVGGGGGIITTMTTTFTKTYTKCIY